MDTNDDSSSEASHMFGFSDDSDDNLSLNGRDIDSGIPLASLPPAVKSLYSPVDGANECRIGSDDDSFSLGETSETIPVALAIEHDNLVHIRVDIQDVLLDGEIAEISPPANHSDHEAECCVGVRTNECQNPEMEEDTPVMNSSELPFSV